MYIRILPPQIQCDLRSSLYFGQYEYVVNLPCKEAWLMRNLNRRVIEQKLVHRENYAGAGATMPAVRETIMCIVETLEKLKSKFMHRSFGWEALHVYTNDLDDVNALMTAFNNKVTVKQAAVVYPSGAIMLATEPKYPYRTYFRDRHMPAAKKQTLWTWIRNQTPDLEASPATKKWFENNGGFKPYWVSGREEWCRGHYYIEHTDLKHLTMMAMIAPGVTRKTVQVQKRP